MNRIQPEGDGLKLGTTCGDSMRLAIVGYQFPEAEDPMKKYSWYIVEGCATSGGQEWQFKWQALTCDAAPLISTWLKQLAGWARDLGVGSSPEPPWLIEPNLQFGDVSYAEETVEIQVELNLEFLPPERRNGRVGTKNPAILKIRATPDELVTAADDFDATISLFPDLSSAASDRRVEG